MTVSVIIPCFNARGWIGETLSSVLDQDVSDLEIIVVDDGSTDGSAELVTRDFSQVRLVRSPRRGPSAARNLGTRLSSGDFIQYLDADDLLGHGKLQQQLRALADTGADVAYGDWSELRSTPGGSVAIGRRVARRIQGDPQLALFTDFWCPPAAYLFRRDIVARVGGWRADLPIIQDARFVLDCALHEARFVYCPGEAARYRVHTTGSVSTRDPREFTRDCLRSAQSVEHWWSQHGGVSPARHAALVQVYGQVARSSFDRDRPTFETAYDALERLEPGYVPPSPRSLRWLARVAGYPRAEAIASRYRWLKRGSLATTSQTRLGSVWSGGSRTGDSHHFDEDSPLDGESDERSTRTQARAVHARLQSVARVAYRLPGVRSRWSTGGASTAV